MINCRTLIVKQVKQHTQLHITVDHPPTLWPKRRQTEFIFSLAFLHLWRVTSGYGVVFSCI